LALQLPWELLDRALSDFDMDFLHGGIDKKAGHEDSQENKRQDEDSLLEKVRGQDD
jgi:hypothetical protein